MLTAFILATHAMAGLALVPVSLPFVLEMLLAAALVVSAVWLGRLHGWQTASWSVTEVLVGADGRVGLSFRNGEHRDGRLRKDTYVHPAVVILRVSDDDRRYRNVVVPYDQVSGEQFRRFRLELLSWLSDPSDDER